MQEVDCKRNNNSTQKVAHPRKGMDPGFYVQPIVHHSLDVQSLDVQHHKSRCTVSRPVEHSMTKIVHVHP